MTAFIFFTQQSQEQMLEFRIWGCLVIVLSLSCVRVHLHAFSCIVCITMLLLTLLPNDVRSFPPSVSSSSDEDSSGTVSARVGGMVPNPRLVKGKKEDGHQGVGDVLNDRTYGQASFEHMLRRKRDSHVALDEAKIKDAIAAGFRP